MIKNKIISFVFVSILTATSCYAESTFSEEQKNDIEKIVHGYIVAHPEVVKEAIIALQTQEEKTLQEQAKSAISTHSEEIFNGQSPSLEPKQPAVTVVEFFDYQCPHCKRMESRLEALLTQNKDLRIVYKELPILNPHSVMAAQAALAARKQDKYLPFHRKLMAMDQELTQENIMAAAKEVGLDVDQLKKDMASPEVANEIKANYKIAQAIGIRGTPVFIVAPHPMNKNKESEFVSGETNQDALQSLIDKAKATSK
ncbi:MAG: DsbA family protein [Gammaproteobacteria bacterium]|nr:DsbA family protein [Gammaproteobacteria bacterium]